MMISNWKIPLGLHGFYKNISTLQGLSSGELEMLDVE